MTADQPPTVPMDYLPRSYLEAQAAQEIEREMFEARTEERRGMTMLVAAILAGVVLVVAAIAAWAA